jgi:hypothetical protein
MKGKGKKYKKPAPSLFGYHITMFPLRSYPTGPTSPYALWENPWEMKSTGMEKPNQFMSNNK